VLEHAIRSAEIGEAVENIVSNRLSTVSGTLRLSAPPTISDTLLTPLVIAFQTSYPDVRVQIFVTDRHIDHIAEGIDLAFRLGRLSDSSLIARKILTYRRQLVASPEYFKSRKAPESPQDLLDHRLLASGAASLRRAGLSAQRQRGQGNRLLSTLPHDQRFRRSHTRIAGGRRHRRASARGSAASDARRPARRSHARLAVS
jgi:DNA-binding transcriptional LysR family regulator